MNESDKLLLQHCISLIEEKYFSNGSKTQLKQRDFEYLLDLIEEYSGIKLSISTIKRVWKNKDSDLNPHPSTLDGLVSLLDYKDWMNFKLENNSIKISPERKENRKKVLGKKIFIPIGLMAIILISTWLFIEAGTAEFPDSDEILFTSTKTVSKGVPSTVIFNYDVSEVKADSFFIQQDWNPNHKDRINPEGEFFSSIYFVPGYHKTKLVANETFLKTIPIHIQTDGWMSAAFYDYDDPPVYITDHKNGDGILTAEKSDVLNSGLDVERFNELRFINIREYSGVDGHNFIAETRFRYRDFLNELCPNIQLTIHTEVHIYYVPLTLKGCESNLSIKIGEVYQEGRDHDLSTFGTDIYNWQELKLKVENKAGTVFLNNEEIYEITFKEDFGDIKGLDFRSQGLSEIDYIILRDLEGKIIYQDEFKEEVSN